MKRNQFEEDYSKPVRKNFSGDKKKSKTISEDFEQKAVKKKKMDFKNYLQQLSLEEAEDDDYF